MTAFTNVLTLVKKAAPKITSNSAKIMGNGSFLFNYGFT